MSEILAKWSITLDTKCPSCGESIDLMGEDWVYDCMVDGAFSAGEHGTEWTTDMLTICPECECAFSVDFDY